MTARAHSEVFSAADEGVKLTRSLGRIDLIFFTIGATFTLDSIAQIAAVGGAESFTWGLIVAVTFLVPYAFITAELGSAFPQEGGPYFWVKFAFGRLAAAISTMLWWITNPVWLGGSLAFLATATWGGFISPLKSGAGVDGSFPKFFGQFHPRLETPVRVNILSGIVATVFCVLATTLVNGSVGAIFAVVLTIAITTLLLSYLIILPSVWALRRTQPDVVRPFRVPGGRTGITVCTALVFLWVAFGSFVAVFPGVLEGLFGIDYDFEGTWGVSRTTFEVFTLGTLAVVVGVAVLGYLWRRLRASTSTDIESVPDTA